MPSVRGSVTPHVDYEFSKPLKKGFLSRILTPRNSYDILQNTLNVSASWFKDWELETQPHQKRTPSRW